MTPKDRLCIIILYDNPYALQSCFYDRRNKKNLVRKNRKDESTW